MTEPRYSLPPHGEDPTSSLLRQLQASRDLSNSQYGGDLAGRAPAPYPYGMPMPYAAPQPPAPRPVPARQLVGVRPATPAASPARNSTPDLPPTKDRRRPSRGLIVGILAVGLVTGVGAVVWERSQSSHGSAANGNQAAKDQANQTPYVPQGLGCGVVATVNINNFVNETVWRVPLTDTVKDPADPATTKTVTNNYLIPSKYFPTDMHGSAELKVCMNDPGSLVLDEAATKTNEVPTYKLAETALVASFDMTNVVFGINKPDANSAEQLSAALSDAQHKPQTTDIATIANTASSNKQIVQMQNDAFLASQNANLASLSQNSFNWAQRQFNTQVSSGNHQKAILEPMSGALADFQKTYETTNPLPPTLTSEQITQMGITLPKGTPEGAIVSADQAFAFVAKPTTSSVDSPVEVTKS